MEIFQRSPRAPGLLAPEPGVDLKRNPSGVSGKHSSSFTQLTLYLSGKVTQCLLKVLPKLVEIRVDCYGILLPKVHSLLP